MENIIKKTAGVMLAASMLCAIMATGCSIKVSDTTDTSSVTSVTEKVTEQATKQPATNNPDLKFEQQTLVDEITGVQVTGMLPVGVEMFTVAKCISTVDLYDVFDTPYCIEQDFPEIKNKLTEHYMYTSDRKTENIAKMINQEGWTEWEGTAGGMIRVEIYFAKDTEIVEFESDFTVTMPFNYRRGLVTDGITDEVVVEQYDYDNNQFVDIELVPAESTPKGMFQFKAKNSGLFFLGGESYIDELMEFYEGHYDHY